MSRLDSGNEIERALDLVGPQLAELVGRSPVPAAELAELAAQVAGQRCLITGAGGSIGSSLASLLARHCPRQLALVDNHENSLFQLQRRLLSTSVRADRVEFVLADVRNEKAMESLLLSDRPQVIFHLAAYKHVPIAQDWPGPFAEVNVLAGWNLLGLAARYEVEKLVYSSTDKAVRPCNVYGATKRAMELALQAYGASGAFTQFVCARLVNVVGARGGVIETFIRQACEGQPLTVTDAAMTRYWITEDEALLLLMSAALWRGSSTTLMLVLQQPCSVVSVAQRLWDLLRGGPEPVPICPIGTRPGERLQEELTYDHERLVAGDSPSIVEVKNLGPVRPSLSDMSIWIDRLRLLVDEQRDSEVREALFSFARDFS